MGTSEAGRRQATPLPAFAVALILAAGAVASFAPDGLRPLAIGLVAVVAVAGLLSPGRVVGPVAGSLAAMLYAGAGLAEDLLPTTAVAVSLVLTGAVGGELGARLAGPAPASMPVPADEQDAEEPAPRTPVLPAPQFRQALALEINRGRRYEHALSLVLIGVEDWPTLVAQRGPIAARRRLHEVAEAVRRVVRDVDSVSVYGLGLLAILLPETPLSGAAVVAQKAERVAREQGNLTIRVGAAAYPDDAATCDELLREAEAALELAALSRVHVVDQARLDLAPTWTSTRRRK